MNDKAPTGKAARTNSVRGKLGKGETRLSEVGGIFPGSKEMFRILVENLSEVVFTIDVSGHFGYISPAIERISGYRPDEVIGLPFGKFVFPDDLPELAKSFERTLSGQDEIASFRAMGKNGKLFFVQTSSRLMMVDGEVVGLSGVMTDITERKQAEDALRKKEQEKQAILDAIPDLIFHLDSKGRILDYKAENRDALFRPPEDFLGKTIQEALPEWLAKISIGYFQIALETKQPQIYEYYLEMGGTTHFYEARMVPYLEDHILTIIRDMTDQKQAEQLTLQTEEKFRALVEQISAIVYTDSAENVGQTKYISPQIKTLLGYDPDEWAKDNTLWIKAIHPDDRERVTAEYDRTYKTGEQFIIEYRLFTNAGKIVWIRDEAVLIHDQLGGPSFWQGIMLDITDRKLAEESLRVSEDKFRNITEQATEGIVLVNEQGLIIEVNQAVAKIFGIDRNEMIGIPFWEAQLFASNPHQGENHKKFLLEALRAGHSDLFNRPFEMALTRPDGEMRFVEQISFPIKLRQGYQVGFLFRDITARKSADDEIHRQLKELTVLHTISQVGTQAVIVDDLLEKITSIIVDTFELDSFGFILFDASAGLMRTHDSYFGDFKENLPSQIPFGKGVTGYVAKTRLPYRVADVRKDKRYIEVNPGMRSELCVPILSGETLIGVINAESSQVNHFSGDDEHLFITIAGTIATVIEKLHLFEAEYIHRQEAEKLRDATTALTSSLELQPLLENILTTLVKIMPHDSASIVFREAMGLRIAAARAIPGKFINADRLYPVNSIWDTIIETRQAYLLDDARNTASFVKWTGSGYIRGWMGVPLLVRGEVIGCLCLDSRTPGVFTHEDAALVQTYANHAASAIENARLFEAERTRRLEAETMRRAAAVVSSSLEVDKVLEMILVSLNEVVPYDSSFVILEQINGDLEIVAERSLTKELHLIGKRFGKSKYWTNLIETHEPLILADAQADPTFAKREETKDVRSWMSIPLIVREKVIGEIRLESRKLNNYSEENALLAQAFAHQAAVAVENARLYEQALQAADRREILYQASQEISRSTQDPEKVYAAVHHAAARLMPAEAFVISILDEASNDIFCVYLVDKLGRSPAIHAPLNSGLSGQVIAAGAAVIIQDLDIQPLSNRVHFGSKDEVRSVLGVPMRLGEKVIGMLSAQAYRPNAYSEEDQRLLEMLAAHAAAAIDNARLFDQVQRRRTEAETLRQVTQVVTTSLDISEAFRLMLEQIKKLFAFDTASMILLGESGQPDLVTGMDYLDEKFTNLAANELLKDSLILKQMAQDLQPLIIADVRDCPDWIWVPGAEHVRSFLAVPLISHQRMIGVLMADSKTPDYFTDDEMRVAQLLAQQMAIVLENARLYQQALQASERRAILHRVSQDMVQAIREPEQTYQSIHQATRQLMACDSFVIGLYDDLTDENNIVYAMEGNHRFPVQHIPAGKGLTGGVVKSGESIIIDDILVEKTDVIRMGEPQPIRSVLAVPLRLVDKTTGMLSAQSYKIHAFGPEEQELLEMLASYAAVAIENARLYQDAVRATDRRSILHEVSQEIVKVGLDLERVYEAVHKAADRLMPAEAFVLSVLDEVHNEIVFAYLFDEGKRWHVDRSPVGVGLSGRVMETGKALIINDLQSTPLPDGRDFGEGEEVRSILAVPLRLGTKVFGMLSVQSYHPYSYTDDDQALLEMLSAHAAVAIDNARLFDQIERRRIEAEALGDATSALTSTLEIDQVMERLLDSLAQVIPFDSATVFLRQGDHLIGNMARGLPNPELVIGHSFSASDILFQRILETHSPVIIPDVQADARFQNLGDTTYVHGWMGIPLIIRDEVIGILTIDNRNPGAYTESHADLASAFANQAATAFEKARLFAEILRKLSDLEVVNRVSTQLRAATRVGEMVPCLLDESLKALNSNSGSILLFDPASGLLKTPLARGWFVPLGEVQMKPGEGVAGHVFSTGKAVVSKEFGLDPLAIQSQKRIPPGWGGACVPIRTGQEIIGVMFISIQLPRELQESDIHLLTTLCEIAGNAIRRADLHEQTERQLQRLASLRTIDMAISTILDLRVTLGILIDHIVSQLKVDAVNVLLINPNTQTLYHAASSGFRSDAVRNSQIYINDGLALQAIRSRSMVFIPNLTETTSYPRLQALSGEGLVTYFGVPLIAKGQVKGILETFHRHPEDPDMDWRGFLETLAGQAAIAIDNSLLFEELQQTNLNLSLAYDATIEGWSKALDLRDRETEGHTLRVTDMTLQLADAMGISTSDLVHIRRGSLLHDIGKMGVPDNILHKTGPLTEDEWVVMHRHPEFAYAMLSPIAYLRSALDVPYCHHERWDGSGYPRQLKGEQIPLAARVFAVVDVYDALTSTRPYRKGWTKKAATDFIRKNGGILFDQKVVDTFLLMLSKK